MASSSSSFTPYTYIQCPCHDSTSQVRPADDAPSPTSQGGSAEDEDDDGAAFDPRAPRSNYSLYPLEYLLYCDVCHQIRCPRCVFEEIVNVYCPNCLFEVASSSLKTEGNRYVLRSTFYVLLCFLTFAIIYTYIHTYLCLSRIHPLANFTLLSLSPCLDAHEAVSNARSASDPSPSKPSNPDLLRSPPSSRRTAARQRPPPALGS